VNKPAEWLHNLIVTAALFFLPLLIIVTIISGTLWLLFGMDACVSSTISTMYVAGLGFRVEDTDCDTLAKEEWVSVYGSADRGRGRTLLFKYDPGSYPLPPTTIQVPDPQTILIAVPRVSEVLFQLDSWNNHAIRYDIGHIDYPRPDPEHHQ
jgi:hypothetical protein